MTRPDRIRNLLRIAGAAALLAFGTDARAAGPTGTVVVLAWPDAFDPLVLEDFTRQTGVRVLIDSYTTPDALAAGLRTPKYDVALVEADRLVPLAKAGRLMPLQAPPPTSTDTPDALLAKALRQLTAGETRALPLAWFGTGLLYRTDKLQDRHVTIAPTDGWEALFKPDALRLLADCGVGVPEDGRSLLGAALALAARDPTAPEAAETRRALASLAAIRPLVRRLPPAGIVEGLATGALCLGLVSEPEAWQATDRARESANGVTLSFLAPGPGGRLFIDALALVATAPDPAEARQFIDFLRHPGPAGRNANFAHVTSAMGDEGERGDAAGAAARLQHSVVLPDSDAAQGRALEAWSGRKGR